jgi:N utilization substance protein B
MAARHASRRRALQVLYQWDLTKQPVAQAIKSYYDTLHSEEDQPVPAEQDSFMEELATGTSDTAGEIDKQIAEYSAHWRLDRMALVDRNILRLAVYELRRGDTPPAVVIDEALELARQFSGDESVSFINGVLDAVHKHLRV